MTTLEILEYTQAKEEFKAGMFNEALIKLYQLASTYPDDGEIQELIIVCLRARREPAKLVEKIEKSEGEIAKFFKWGGLFLVVRQKITGKQIQPTKIIAELG